MNELTTKYDIEFWHVGMIEKELINIIKRYSNSKMNFLDKNRLKNFLNIFLKHQYFVYRQFMMVWP